MSEVPAHVVHVDRKKNFSSPTLPDEALRRLEAVYRSVPWWRDRWRAKLFRDAARAALREHGGLTLIGPDVKIDVPPPFSEMFEPIEIGTGLGDEGERLKVLSGDAPTSQERFAWIAKWIAGIAAGVVLLVFVSAFLKGMPPIAMMILLGFTVAGGLVLWIFIAVRRLRGRCFLVPGAVALVRRPVRRGQPPRVTVLSRADTCPVIRYVYTGKTTVLTMDLLTHAGKAVSRAVSEREAMGLLATWQGNATPPADDKLMELVSW